MSTWKVVSLERSWIGNPRLLSEGLDQDAYDAMHNWIDPSKIPAVGTGRPDEITYTMKLEKRETVNVKFDGLSQPVERLLVNTATATVTVRYEDGKDEVTAEIAYQGWDQDYPMLPVSFLVTDHLRDFEPPLIWGT